MKKVVVNFKVGDKFTYANLEADELVLVNDLIVVQNDNRVVGLYHKDSVINAHITEKDEKR